MVIKSLAQTLKDLATGIKNTITGITSSNATLTIIKGNGTTSTVTVNNVANAGAATKATQDSAGQQINSTYIKGLSVSGQTITYTKGNNTTGTITTQDTVYTHPNSGVTAGTYKSVTVNAQGHVTAGSNPTTLAEYGITDASLKGHTHDDRYYTESEIDSKVNTINSSIGTKADKTHTHDDRYYTESEADNLLSQKSDIGHTHSQYLTAGSMLNTANLQGIISVDNLPNAALERLVNVADDTARFALTEASVQLGDTVKVANTGLMYIIKDISKLNSEAGYEVYTAGSASSVPWSGVTGKPSSYTPSAHNHDDRYYTESEINNKVNTINSSIDTKSDKTHTHDDRYYTESEIDSKLAGKQGSLTATGSATKGMYIDSSGTAKAMTYSVNKDVPSDAKFTDTVYTHPTTAGNKHIPSGGSSGQILRWSADGTAVWGADNNTTYSPATQSANGLMSAADKKKLDGIATGANAYTHPNSGVTAGTYRNVTVNAQGHVTGGSNPTTLAGYGITDASLKGHTHDDRYYTESEMNTKLAGKSDTSHTHSYLPLSGGTTTGKVNMKSANLDNLPQVFRTDGVNFAGIRFQNTNGYLGAIGITGNVNSVVQRLGANGTLYPMLDSSNYNNYAPTKTGGGASGTWGINITGNAKTATTAGNSDKLDGHLLTAPGRYYGAIPKIGSDGVMEIGKYIDWHATNNDTEDYSSRWQAKNDGTVSVGTINGTLNGNAASATTANTAKIISGFAYIDDGTWGHSTGTYITGFREIGGGSIQWRAEDGRLYERIDGTFWQREGTYEVIDTSTVNNYSPTKTGGGASGTWGINISGNAASANRLSPESGNNYLSIDTTKDSWDVIGSNPGSWLKSIRTNGSAPPYSIGNYSAAIAFGGADTKGIITHAYGSPNVKFAGGAGSTARWKFTIYGGYNNETYDLNNFPTKTGGGASGTWGINISGNATKDSAGQQINTTYIKGLSVSGKTITYTKGNGSTGTITTQDTVYTLPAASSSTLGGIKMSYGTNDLSAGSSSLATGALYFVYE